MSLSLISYTGSKRLDIKFFENYIPENIECIVEPFGGSGYLSLYMFSKNNNLKSIINDIDYNLINFFNQMKKNPDEIILGYNNLLLSYSNKDEYLKIINEYKQNEGDEKRRAILFLFFTRCYNLKYGLYPQEKKFKPIDKNKYKTFFNWLNNSTFICGDYMPLYNLHKDNKKNFIFLDPPYLDSFNAYYSSHQFNNIDNTTIYLQILDMMKKNNKSYLMLIINNNALTKYLYGDFIIGEYSKIYNNVNKKKVDGNSRNQTIHLVISNKNKLLP